MQKLTFAELLIEDWNLFAGLTLRKILRTRGALIVRSEVRVNDTFASTSVSTYKRRSLSASEKTLLMS